MRYLDPDYSPTLESLLSLRGKAALITGGAGLLGSQISAALAELGAGITVASRDEGKCAAFAKALAERHPECIANAAVLDITNTKSINEAIARTVASHGRLDILVNCSWSGRKNTFETISEEDWLTDIDVSLNGVYRTVKGVVPHLRKTRGVILNIASVYGHVAPDYRLYVDDTHANPPSYGAAKAGVIQFTRYLASFLSPYGIRVNCISPGPFPYESTQREDREFTARLAAHNPLNRIGRPHELKGIAALLCSDASSYITGQNISVDGGWAIW